MNPPFVSLIVGACCAVSQTILVMLVVRRRRLLGIGFLDGGDAILLRRMRVHGNFTETVPLMLLLLLMLELAGLPPGWLWGLGAALLSSRGLHARGLLAAGPGRFAGTLMTLLVLGAQALAVFVLALC